MTDALVDPDSFDELGVGAGEAEYDAKGKKIWSMKVTSPGEVNRY